MAKPKILVLADEIAKQAVINAGYDTIDINQNAEYLAILIDMDGNHSQFAQDIIDKLGDNTNTRLLTFAWLHDNPSHETYQKMIEIGFDGVFTSATPTKFISARLDAAIRIKIMAKEAQIRSQSIEVYEPKRFVFDKIDKKPFRVLLYGEPGPFSLKITSILDKLGINVIASLSSFTAFDFLHRGNFDAIIVVAKDDKNGIGAFCNGLRRNSRLYHLPCVVFANEDFDNLEELIERGASDVNYIGIEDELAVARLMSLIDEKRRREQLAIAFAMTKTAKVADSGTGLYNSDFFATHFLNSIHHMRRSKQSLSIGFLRIVPNFNDEKANNFQTLRRVLTQAGSMIARLIRVEDSAFKTDTLDFAIMFPSADAVAANNAINRICAVIETSAFSIGPDEAVSVITNKYIHQVTDGDDLTLLLSIAQAKLA